MPENQEELLKNEEQSVLGENAGSPEANSGEQAPASEVESEESPKASVAEGEGGGEGGESPVLLEDGLEVPVPDLKPKTTEEYIEERLRKKREREERKLAELQQEQIQREREEIARIRAEQATIARASAPPNRDDFESEAEFLEATVNYTMAKRQLQNRIEQEERNKYAAQQKLMREVEETKNQGSAKYSDFEEVVAPLFDSNGDVPPNIPLVQALNESEYGADILYMLGRNKQKAREVASMHPAKALRWVWETEKKIEQVRAKTKSAVSGQSQVKAMSKVNSKLTPQKDIGSMTTKEYAEHWKKTRYSR